MCRYSVVENYKWRPAAYIQTDMTPERTSDEWAQQKTPHREKCMS